MTEQAELARRLAQVENALADAQGRLPALRAEVHAIRQALAGKALNQGQATPTPGTRA